MCPGTLAIASAAASAAGSLFGGIAAGNAAAYQAQVASNNARIARQNAAYSAAAGAANIETAGLQAREHEAGIRASIGANNIDVNSGSAADVERSSRIIGQLDTNRVGEQAGNRVYGYETEASSNEAQSKLYNQESTADFFGGVLGATGSLGSSSSVTGLFGSGSAADGAQTFAPGATGAPQSLLLGDETDVPDQYAWMLNPESGGTGEIW